MPGAGFGRQFARGGSAFYCGRVFTARHMSCVSSPLITGFIAPTAFLSTSAMAVGDTAWSPLASADQMVKGASAFECDAELVEPVRSSAGIVRAYMEATGGASLVATFLKISCMPNRVNIRLGSPVIVA